MARRLRVEYAGAIYHVMNRGDHREAIFADDEDRKRFLETLGEACDKTDWQVLAWCLMSNHFHLVVETPRPNLVVGMKWFLGTYTSRYNRRHRVFGHLFSGRYKALIVDGSSNGYLRTVCDYVHLNPVRAELLGPKDPLADYPWSSCREYLKKASERAKWLKVERLLGEMCIPRDSAAGRRGFEKIMERRRTEKTPEKWEALRRGWCLGEEGFRQELLEQMHGRMGRNHGGSERRESEEAGAEGIVLEELKRRKWGKSELTRRRKGDLEKVKIARRLRQETTMTLRWIGRRLKMGEAGSLANLLRKVG